MNGEALVQAPGSAPPLEARELLALAAGRLAPTTRAAYRSDWAAVARWAGLEDLAELVAWLIGQGPGACNRRLWEFRAACVEAGLSAATINRRLCALRSLVELARSVGAIPWSAAVPGLPAHPYRETSGPGLDVVRALVTESNRAISPRGERDQSSGVRSATNEALGRALRDRAVLECLAVLALRRGTVSRLDLADLQAGRLQVIRKGGRTERLDLPPSSVEVLEAWTQARQGLAHPAELALFVQLDRGSGARRNQRLSGAAIWRLVRALARRAGLPPTWPHALRHTAITAALDASGGDLRGGAAYAGHRDPGVTMIYDDARQRRDLGRRLRGLVAELVR